MVRSEDMRDKSIGKLLWSFSLPAIVGMVINSLYNVIDRIFLGRGIGSVGISATALISIHLGEQKKEQAEKVAGNAIGMLILLPVFIAIIFLLFTEPILIAFGASPEVLPYAKDFMRIIMLGSAFGSISMGMNNFIRAEGNPKMAMYTQILKPQMPILLSIVAIGFAPFAIQIASSIQQLILNRTLFAYGGDMALSLLTLP